MLLERLVQSVEAKLFGWLGDERAESLVDQRRAILDEINREDAERERLLAARAEAVPLVESMTQEAALLPSRIEGSLARGKASQALRQSLELESLRRMLDEARRDLARLDEALWSREFRLRQLRRRFAEMPSPFPKARR